MNAALGLLAAWGAFNPLDYPRADALDDAHGCL
jgi:hypothetical protein